MFFNFFESRYIPACCGCGQHVPDGAHPLGGGPAKQHRPCPPKGHPPRHQQIAAMHDSVNIGLDKDAGLFGQMVQDPAKCNGFADRFERLFISNN
jgi:hypothetical protein